MNENPYDAPQEQNNIQRFFWPKLNLLNVFVIFILMAIIVAILLPAPRRALPAARRTQCKNNLKQIMLALHNYEETYKSFPPAYTVDDKGQPLHSWRTLILPFVDQQALYKKIDLSQPWNSPANVEAFRTAMPIYACPSVEISEGMTTYQAIIGPEAFFDPSKPRTQRDFADGLSNTLAIAEVNPELAVHWMSPFDHGKEFLLTQRSKMKLQHTGGTNFGVGDGTVHFVSESLNLETRRALITINGSETIGDW